MQKDEDAATCIPGEICGAATAVLLFCKKKILIKEASVDGYISAVSGDAATGFVITNTHTPTAEQPDTGDYTTMKTIIMIATLAGVAVLGTILLVTKRRQKK